MAYFTYITELRDLTEAELGQVNSYVSTQTTAGTTDGQRYMWTTSHSSPTPDLTRYVRMWGTIESATGLQTLMAGFSPAVPVAVY